MPKMNRVQSRSIAFFSRSTISTFLTVSDRKNQHKQFNTFEKRKFSLLTTNSPKQAVTVSASESSPIHHSPDNPHLLTSNTIHRILHLSICHDPYGPQL
jgi:hypothetical protein